MGGESIYGRMFDDENFKLKFTQAGLLAMANSGPDTNGSQFFITLTDTTWLNGLHVVFGQLLEGQDVLDALEAISSRDGTPRKTAEIADSGQLNDKGQPMGREDQVGYFDDDEDEAEAEEELAK